MKLVLAITAALVAAVPARSDLSFTVMIGGKTASAIDVRQGARVEMTVAVEWPQTTMTYMVYTPTMRDLEGARICDHVSFGETLTTISQTLQRIVHHFTIAVTTAVGATAETGPIEVQYRGSNDTEPVTRRLAGITFNLLPASRWPVAGTVGGGFVAVIAGIAAWLAGIRHRRRTAQHPAVSATSEDGYLVRLDGLKHLRLEGDLERYFAGMEALLREYFKEKYRVASIETWQAPSTGPAGPDERTAAVARELLDLSRKVRYAGYIPAAHEQSRISEFLRTLFSRNQPRRPAAEDEHYLTKETDHE